MDNPLYTKNKYTLKRDIFIEWEMLDSEVFKKLSGKAKNVLLRFLQKRTWTGKGKKTKYINSGLAFTYTEAKALGISTSQFHTIIKMLYEVGFIDIDHQGGGLARDYSRYSISERWWDYGTSNFNLVTKERVLWPNQDVHSRKQALNKVTENRSCLLRKTVVIGGIENMQGAGKP
jgi:hypothetical protein